MKKKGCTTKSRGRQETSYIGKWGELFLRKPHHPCQKNPFFCSMSKALGKVKASLKEI